MADLERLKHDNLIEQQAVRKGGLFFMLTLLQ